MQVLRVESGFSTSAAVRQRHESAFDTVAYLGRIGLGLRTLVAPENNAVANTSTPAPRQLKSNEHEQTASGVEASPPHVLHIQRAEVAGLKNSGLSCNRPIGGAVPMRAAAWAHPRTAPEARLCRRPAAAASQDRAAGIRFMPQSFATCCGCLDESETAALQSCRVRGRCEAVHWRFSTHFCACTARAFLRNRRGRG